jgi:hypothetical protein
MVSAPGAISRERHTANTLTLPEQARMLVSERGVALREGLHACSSLKQAYPLGIWLKLPCSAKTRPSWPG